MNEPKIKREKRFITDIGKDSDDLISRIHSFLGNKKMTKKELIYRSLEHIYRNKINLKESAEKTLTQKDLVKLEKNLLEKMAFFSNDINTKIDLLKKQL